MKYLRILLDPIKIKADPEDELQLQVDLYELIQTMIENETLGFTIDDEDDDSDED